VPILDARDLQTSTNPMIAALVASDFIGVSANIDSLINDLRKDMPRGLTLNQVEYVDSDGNIHFDENNKPLPVIVANGQTTVADAAAVKVTKNFVTEGAENYFSDAEFKAMLDNIFPGKFGETDYSSVLIASYTQSLLGYALAAPDLAIRTSSDNLLGMGEKRQQTDAGGKLSTTKSNNIYFSEHDHLIYLEATIGGFDIFDTYTKRNCTIEGVTWSFVLEEKGFKLVEITVPDERMKQMYLSLDAPAKLDDVIEYTLSSRIRDAFHEIYNPFSTNYSRDAAAFFGFKEAANDYLQNYETLELLALPFTFVKNTLKLFTEFFPRAIEKTMEKIVAHSRNSIKNLYLLGLANIVPTLIFGAAWGFRQIASRLTSPIESMKSAYAKGASVHPLVGVAAAGLSVALSLGLMIATGAAGVAILSAAGTSAAVTAAAWITSHTGVIGSFLTFVAAKATAALGITLSSAPVVLAASTLASTILVGVMALREGIKAGLGKLFRMKEKRELEKKEEQRLASQSTEPTTHMQPRINVLPTVAPQQVILRQSERVNVSPTSSFATIHASLNPANSGDEKIETSVTQISTTTPSMSTHGGPVPSPTATTASPMASATPMTSASPTLFKPKAKVEASKKPEATIRRTKSCIF
jgi:hypothetical protein